MYRILFLILLLSLSIRAQDSLSGTIGDMTFEPSKGPFIVKDHITVEEGKKTVLKAGCVFLFRPFIGIIVNGSLSVEGTSQSPVIFTSCSDEKYVPGVKTPAAPFDWNGIFICPHAGDASFSNIELAYSVYGIKSQKEGIVLECALFKANGQFHFTIMDKIQEVIDGVPVNYRKKTEEKTEVNTNPGKSSAFSNAIPLIVGASGLVTGAAAVVSFIILSNAKKDFSSEVDPIKQKNLESKYNSARTTGIVFTGVTAICLPLATILYIKNTNHNKKSVLIRLSPTLGHETGIALAIDF